MNEIEAARKRRDQRLEERVEQLEEALLGLFGILTQYQWDVDDEMWAAIHLIQCTLKDTVDE